MKTQYFKQSAIYASHMAARENSGVAVVTGGRSGIGRAIALKIASFPFIDTVFAVSRSISKSDDIVQASSKIVPLAADVTTEEGRTVILDAVQEICGGNNSVAGAKKQLRYLVHSAGSIEPIKPVLQVKPEELRQAMLVNCEAPLLLSTTLYPYMQRDGAEGPPGWILHVSSGAAHGAPPVGWSCYGISKAAFYQSAKVLQREFAGKVLVGTFKPGVVDTDMQGEIRAAPSDAMPAVSNFEQMKQKAAKQDSVAKPPVAGGLDSPSNVAFFAEYLLTGTTDEDFTNEKDATNEYDIRDRKLYPLWIAPENL